MTQQIVCVAWVTVVVVAAVAAAAPAQRPLRQVTLAVPLSEDAARQEFDLWRARFQKVSPARSHTRWLGG
jgi:hypothetical protein